MTSLSALVVVVDDDDDVVVGGGVVVLVAGVVVVVVDVVDVDNDDVRILALGLGSSAIGGDIAAAIG